MIDRIKQFKAEDKELCVRCKKLRYVKPMGPDGTYTVCDYCGYIQELDWWDYREQNGNSK